MKETKGLPIKEIAILAAVAIGGYLIFKYIKPITDAAGAVGGAVGAATSPFMISTPYGGSVQAPSPFSWLFPPLFAIESINAIAANQQTAANIAAGKTPVSEPRKVALIPGGGIAAPGYTLNKAAGTITKTPISQQAINIVQASTSPVVHFGLPGPVGQLVLKGAGIYKPKLPVSAPVKTIIHPPGWGVWK